MNVDKIVWLIGLSTNRTDGLRLRDQKRKGTVPSTMRTFTGGTILPSTLLLLFLVAGGVDAFETSPVTLRPTERRRVEGEAGLVALFDPGELGGLADFVTSICPPALGGRVAMGLEASGGVTPAGVDGLPGVGAV